MRRALPLLLALASCAALPGGRIRAALPGGGGGEVPHERDALHSHGMPRPKPKAAPLLVAEPEDIVRLRVLSWDGRTGKVSLRLTDRFDRPARGAGAVSLRFDPVTPELAEACRAGTAAPTHGASLILAPEALRGGKYDLARAELRAVGKARQLLAADYRSSDGKVRATDCFVWAGR